MKKRIRYFVVVAIVVLLACVGCKNLKKGYWSYDCVWYSEKPYVYLVSGGSIAVIGIDEQEYDCFTEKKLDGTGVNFYIKGIDNEDIYLWKTESNIKNDKLYLTIVEDNISDYQGKTIELVQIPYDEKTIEELLDKYK